MEFLDLFLLFTWDDGLEFIADHVSDLVDCDMDANNGRAFESRSGCDTLVGLAFIAGLVSDVAADGGYGFIYGSIESDGDGGYVSGFRYGLIYGSVESDGDGGYGSGFISESDGDGDGGYGSGLISVRTVVVSMKPTLFFRFDGEFIVSCIQ